MKGIKAKDLRGNEPDELLSTLRKLEEDRFKNRMKRVTNQLENTMLLRQARRDIARINTVLGEKSRASSASGGSKPAGTTASAASTQAGKEK
jgi:large subunit ribosomal protein L29